MFLNTRKTQSYEKVMFEVKVVPVHTMKAYRGSSGIVPLILNHDTIWRRVANFTPRAALGDWFGSRAGLTVVLNRKISCPCDDLREALRRVEV